MIIIKFARQNKKIRIEYLKNLSVICIQNTRSNDTKILGYPSFQDLLSSVRQDSPGPHGAVQVLLRVYPVRDAIIGGDGRGSNVRSAHDQGKAINHILKKGKNSNFSGPKGEGALGPLTRVRVNQGKELD